MPMFYVDIILALSRQTEWSNSYASVLNRHDIGTIDVSTCWQTVWRNSYAYVLCGHTIGAINVSIHWNRFMSSLYHCFMWSYYVALLLFQYVDRQNDVTIRPGPIRRPTEGCHYQTWAITLKSIQIHCSYFHWSMITITLQLHDL